MLIKTLREKLKLKNEVLSINSNAWPQFMLHWHCPDWSHLFTTFSDYQVLLIEHGRVLGFGHTIPLYWDIIDLIQLPDDLKVLIEIGVENHKKDIKPNILLALAVVIAIDSKGKGLSSDIVKAMKKSAQKNGINTLIVPVRPTLKPIYPLITIDNYSKWELDDGLPFDPWLRVHKILGGEVFKTANESMLITGSVKEWESWTGVKILGNGNYIFDGALNPVAIDYDNDVGKYTDPCIWVRYEV